MVLIWLIRFIPLKNLTFLKELFLKGGKTWLCLA